MNTDHQIDKMFREGLEGSRIDPPPHLWGTISAGTGKVAPVSVNGQRRRRGWLLWISGTGLLLLTGIILLLVIPRGNELREQSTGDSSTTPFTGQPHQPTDAPATAAIRQPEVVQHKTENPAIPAEPQTLFTLTSSEEIKKPAPTITPEILTEIAVIAEGTAAAGLASTETAVTVAEPATPAVTAQIIVSEEPAPAVQENQEEKSTQNMTEDLSKAAVPDMFKAYTTGLALYGGPLFFRPAWPDPQKIRAGFDGSVYGHFQYKRVSLGAGLGIKRFSEKSPWEFEVLQLDTTGTYQYVTGVSFQPVYHPVDSTITGYTPVNITTVNFPVIDTSMAVITRDAINRYTYLQIPVFAGYDLWQGDPFTLTAMAGVIRNIMITETRPIPKYADESLVYARNDLGLIRKEEYWQYQFGLRMRYDLNHAWYAEAMTAYRRPFNDVYQGSAGDAKLSMMLISAGIGFWF